MTHQLGGKLCGPRWALAPVTPFPTPAVSLAAPDEVRRKRKRNTENV